MSAPAVARGAVKRAAAAADVVRRPPSGITVLIYHRVGARTPVPVDLPTQLFAEQVATVAGRATTLDDALATLAGPASPEQPARDVVVTFDDGTADVVEEALPVLVEHRVPALLYLATHHVEAGEPFPDDGRPASWSALADALSTGWLEIGSHTHSHALLDRLPPDLVAPELDRSVGLIRERLGVDPVHFAYPKALPGSAAADALVRDRFRSAALAGTRRNVVGRTDPFALARSPVQVADGLRWFSRKVDGGMGLEDDLRRTVNRVRHRTASR
ncbi:polysaccharide deacetylase family protein [Iamia majanohamensis]|uniref:Polysaccharide deacetylase family protein n=1 Tax=Iamia majanohamensis TaxID=467976 RepID=A0AAF0BU97_9ACTN|nr:polysaccharide deacetylase family protein [Iamia majanohamensis]WCO65858.1 polysaccharide deacetylase family protein [Iamia majanohamensis]